MQVSKVIPLSFNASQAEKKDKTPIESFSKTSKNLNELPDNYYNRALVRKSNISFAGAQNPDNVDVKAFYTKHKDFLKGLAEKKIPDKMTAEQEIILSSLGLGDNDIKVIGDIS